MKVEQCNGMNPPHMANCPQLWISTRCWRDGSLGLVYALLRAGFMTVPFLLSVPHFPHFFSHSSESLIKSIWKHLVVVRTQYIWLYNWCVNIQIQPSSSRWERNLIKEKGKKKKKKFCIIFITFIFFSPIISFHLLSDRKERTTSALPLFRSQSPLEIQCTQTELLLFIVVSDFNVATVFSLHFFSCFTFDILYLNSILSC